MVENVASPFLEIPAEQWVLSNDLAFAVRDAYPVSLGHTLVVTRRLVPDWWSATDAERASLLDLVGRVRVQLDGELAPDGYNIGINVGEAAGQTVPHLHVHVIPRYAGDVADPRGGIRHVIPGRGNYLSAYGTPVDRSGPGSGSTSIGSDSGFLQRLLALLQEGRQVATYKPALLMALIDACSGRGVTDAQAAVSIPVTELAEQVIDLYWQQTRPHPLVTDRHWYRLRQESGESPVMSAVGGRPPRQARVLRAVDGLRAVATACGWTTPGQVRLGDAVAWGEAVDVVAEALAKQPIPRLQRPGGWSGSGYETFLYDDSAFGEGVSRRRAVELEVELRPGVAAELVRAAPVLRPAIEAVWTRKVADLNGLDWAEGDLRAFLFDEQRKSLGLVRDALMDTGVRECFWCGLPLRGGVEVDHVIPWSRSANDSLFNLVLADPRCNGDKKDILVVPAHIERWILRPTDPLLAAEAALDWPVEPRRSLMTAVAAYAWMPDGVPLWEAIGVRAVSRAVHRQAVVRMLREAV